MLCGLEIGIDVFEAANHCQFMFTTGLKLCRPERVQKMCHNSSHSLSNLLPFPTQQMGNFSLSENSETTQLTFCFGIEAQKLWNVLPIGSLTLCRLHGYNVDYLRLRHYSYCCIMIPSVCSVFQISKQSLLVHPFPMQRLFRVQIIKFMVHLQRRRPEIL